MRPDQGQSLASVIASVELRQVRLVQATVRTRVRDASTIPNAEVSLTHTTWIMGRGASGFLVAANLRAFVLSKGQEPGDQSPISVDVLFELAYALPDALKIDNEVLREFARVNGAFNAWPYWREYVQSTIARMNLPPLVLPVFRVLKADSPAGKKKTSDGKTQPGTRTRRRLPANKT
jgi:hypothetical protein